MSRNQVMLICIGVCVAVVFCRAVSCLIEIRIEWWRRILLFLSSFILIFMVIFVGDVVNLPPALLFFLFGIWNACRGSRLKRLTIGLMLASTMLALNALFDNCISRYLHDSTDDEYYMYYLGFRACSVILLYVGIRQHRPECDFELAPSLWKLLLVLCMPPAGIVCFLVLFNNPKYSDRIYVPMNAALFSVAALAFAGNLWAMLVLNRQQKLERENVLAEHNRKYYEAMEQQQFEIRRLKHDLANHLQVVLSLPAEEKDNYIQRMMDNPAFERVLSYSGDATVNAVLTAKESAMCQRGISFYAKVDIPKALSYEKPDLCALFANALDNALEACASLPMEKRKIELTARAAKGILALEVKNPFEGKQETEAGQLPKTTKTDALNHGFGLRSIQEIVKKYGGSMEVKQEDGWFCLFCFMPEDCDGKR